MKNQFLLMLFLFPNALIHAAEHTKHTTAAVAATFNTSIPYRQKQEDHIEALLKQIADVSTSTQKLDEQVLTTLIRQRLSTKSLRTLGYRKRLLLGKELIEALEKSIKIDDSLNELDKFMKYQIKRTRISSCNKNKNWKRFTKTFYRRKRKK